MKYFSIFLGLTKFALHISYKDIKRHIKEYGHPHHLSCSLLQPPAAGNESFRHQAQQLYLEHSGEVVFRPQL
jgi:hypothetical protein